MNAKVLIGHWPQEHGHIACRVYMEPDYEQAEKDLALLQEADTGGKSYHLQECEVFPSELLEQRNELLDCCLTAKAMYEAHGIDGTNRIGGEQYKTLIEVINKVKS